MAEEIKIQIVLEDGSVKQGFLNIEKQAKNTGKKIESSLDGFSEGLEEIAPAFTSSLNRVSGTITKVLSNPLIGVGIAVAGIGLAFKKALDLTIEGEKLNRIEKTFNNLTAQFGIAGDKLKNDFVGSLGGLVEDSSALESLNKAIITLGSRAASLPQIMDLARKATKLFGGEVTSNFEAINQAVATGNTRTIRGLGLIINAEDAYKKYAKSIGVSSQSLSEAGKQQALLNEVLSKGGERFKNISADAGGATGSLQRMSVAMNNLGGAIAQSMTKNSGYFASFFDSITLFAKRLSGDAGQALEDLQIKIFKTSFEIFELQNALERRKEPGFLNSVRAGFDGQGSSTSITNLINQARINLASFQKQLDVLNKKDVLPNASGVATPDSSIDSEALVKGQKASSLEFTSFLLQQNQSRIASEIDYNNTRLTLSKSSSDKLSIFNKNTQLQESLAFDQHQQAIKSINEKYTAENFFTESQKNSALVALKTLFDQQEITRKLTNAAALKTIQDQSNFDSLSGFQQVSSGFVMMAQGAADAASEFSLSASKSFKDLGKQAFTSITQGIGGAFAAYGAALRKGENAGDAFVESTLKMFGSLAVNIGTYFVALGAAKLFGTPQDKVDAIPLMSAGAALAVLGGFLGATTAGPETGGGIASSPSSSTELTPAESLTRQQPGTSVSLTVQGNILDSDESGSRIVALINSAFDKKGVVINQGVMA